MPTLTKLYSIHEASQHNTKGDCWVVISGKVYDVSSYLDEHPGGDDVILATTGQDSSDEFEDAGHSKDARELLESFCIGEVDPTSPSFPELEIVTKKQPVIQKMVDLTTQYWPVSIAVVGICIAASYLCTRKR